jgi:hypothetical protein
MVDEITASIFDDPTPGMASSSHACLLHITLPSFFDSSMYIRPGEHWTAHHDYAPSDDH